LIPFGLAVGADSARICGRNCVGKDGVMAGLDPAIHAVRRNA
jgi:hypothetical protein